MEESSTPSGTAILAQDELRSGSLVLAMVMSFITTQLLFLTETIRIGAGYSWTALAVVLAVTVGSIILCRGGGILVALALRARSQG